MATPFMMILFFLSLILCCQFSFPFSDYLNEGSSMSVESVGDALTSKDGTFSAGFQPIGQNAYCFAIWFNKPSCNGNCTMVWMANRDHPINGRQSKLSLLKSGNLILTDAKHIIVWESKTGSRSFTRLKLYETGNLVLHDFEGVTLWQSFDFPTDTLLPLQQFNKDSKLVSYRSQMNYSSGFYQLYFDTDNVLSLLYEGHFSSVYWPTPWLLRWEAGRSTFNDSRIAALDLLGNFSSSDQFTFRSADYGSKIPRRLKLDCDGNLRLYSLSSNGETWVVSWQAFPRGSLIHGICGPNSLCTFIPNEGKRCACAPGHKMRNRKDWSFGCEPEFDHLSCDESEVGFMKLRHSEFFGYDYGLYPNYTIAQCMNLCLTICGCKGFQFRFIKTHQPFGTYCYLKTELRNGHHEPNHRADFYIKLPKAYLSSSFNEHIQDYKLECSSQVQQLERIYPKDHENSSLKSVLWSAVVVGGIEFFTILFVWCFLIGNRHSSRLVEGYHLAPTSFTKFSYTELEKATNGFKNEIGRGAGGIVYKGKLSDNRVAAIKRLLIDANQGEDEFLAEVNTIGKLNHMNLIDLWGYCAERKHKLLVYEYMEHGSLAENLSLKTLDWKKRYEVAVGTARGLAYLHEECLEWVLHCDIKPQNILIDSDYKPKVSDFGLSWLLNRGDDKRSKISKIRGTRGYMAPEWVLNMPITSKVDVYSYGIVLLELVTGRNPSMAVYGANGEKEEEQGTLVKWVKEHIAMAKQPNQSESWMEVVVDSTLNGEFDKEEMVFLITLALKCVQDDKEDRPTMREVVQLLLRVGENQ